MSKWIKVCHKGDVLPNGGSCVMVEEIPIAIFYFQEQDEWYAVDNVCPHKKQSVLSRGLIGEVDDEPKVACPLHKNQFSLKTGKHLGGTQEWALKTYSIKVENNDVYLNLNE